MTHHIPIPVDHHLHFNIDDQLPPSQNLCPLQVPLVSDILLLTPLADFQILWTRWIEYRDGYTV